MEVTTVFLSSTFKDLQAYRNAAREVLSQIDRVQCIDMERFGARPDAADPYCRKLVAQADLYVGVLGHCYGSCPDGSPRSFTEGEFDAALEARRDQLVFLLADEAPVQADEPPEAREKQQTFRSRVRRLLVVDVFVDAAELALKVSLAVNNWLRTRDIEQYGAVLVAASRALGQHYARAGTACVSVAGLLAATTILMAVLAGILGQVAMIVSLVLFVAAMVLGGLGLFFWSKEQEARLAPHRYIDKGEIGLDRLRTRKQRRIKRRRNIRREDKE